MADYLTMTSLGHIWLTVILYTSIGGVSTSHAKTDDDATHFYYANLNYSYISEDGLTMHSDSFSGKFGTTSKIEVEYGRLINVMHRHKITNESLPNGCQIPENENIPPNTRWIALVKRGMCKFQTKIENTVLRHNASSVIVYDNIANAADKHEVHLQVMQHDDMGIVTVFISNSDGKKMAKLLDEGRQITINIFIGGRVPNPHEQKNPESVFYVSVSFIVLMIISLAWLVFYYVQRFRYAHAKERLSRKLIRAARKALSKIPVRTLKAGDKETMGEWEQCAICIENYCAQDVVRVLSCRHIFHKSCVDPWLLDHRSCPICKMDILRAYGLQVQGAAQENMVRYNLDAPSSSSTFDSNIDNTVETVHVVPVVHQSSAILHPNTTATQSVILHTETTVAQKPPQLRAASLESVNSLGCSEFQSLMVIKAHSSGLNNTEHRSDKV